MTPNDVPHIQAECANCHFIFLLNFGVTCPKCHMEGVRWARLVTEEDVARTRLRTALERFTSFTSATHFGHSDENFLDALDNDLHEGDHIILHGLGVQWEGDNRP
jgi:hypothetical protein